VDRDDSRRVATLQLTVLFIHLLVLIKIFSSKLMQIVIFVVGCYNAFQLDGGQMQCVALPSISAKGI
jgi:hypothetical protein